MEDDTLFDQIDSFTEHWADDAEYSLNFAPFSNDEEFASFLFDCIEDYCYNYYDFFAFLGQGPLLLKNHEFMESIYHKMAKVIVRNHHGKIDYMDLYGYGPPSHILDEEIEMHLSGIKKSIEEINEEIKSKKIAYRSFDGQPLDISNLKSKKKTDA